MPKTACVMREVLFAVEVWGSNFPKARIIFSTLNSWHRTGVHTFRVDASFAPLVWPYWCVRAECHSCWTTNPFQTREEPLLGFVAEPAGCPLSIHNTQLYRVTAALLDSWGAWQLYWHMTNFWLVGKYIIMWSFLEPSSRDSLYHLLSSIYTFPILLPRMWMPPSWTMEVTSLVVEQ